jgi:DNA adenine methylase
MNALPVIELTRQYRSPLRYPGGKQKAIAQIARHLPNYINEYREAMVGGGSVYFYVRSLNLANHYWLNDKFEDLFNFWSSVQKPSACKRLMNELYQLRTSFNSADEIKQYFLQARDEKPNANARRALLFFFFNRVTFSGTTLAGGFSASASIHRFTESAIGRLATMPEALAGTTITNESFEKVIAAPGKDVFIFLDPPYQTSTKLYGANGRLHDFDHEQMAAMLRKTDHRFLITYDDCPEIRKLYKWAKVSNWQLQYGMNNCNEKNLSKRGSELFIKNY